MDQQSVLIASASEVAQSFLRTARDQVRAAQAEAWNTVFELADFREILLRRLAEVTSLPLTDRDRNELASALFEVQALDVEITRRAEDESRRLLDELNTVEQGRTVAHSYALANVPRQSAIVNRYG